MNIVVLDGITLNPGDISWDEIKALGHCEIYDRSAPSEVLPRSAKAEILLTNKVPLTRAEIERLPRLKYIGILATGINVVDLVAAHQRGVVVTNVPAYGTKSVAQTTIALLLELTQHVGSHADSVRAGKWLRSPDWCYWDQPLIELDGLTLGIIGFGRIGRVVGKLGRAFGMKVITCVGKDRPLPRWARRVDLETAFRQSDVLSLHCPLTPETENLANGRRLSWMKPSAFLINTSRGKLVDEQALAAALKKNRLAGAGLDVLSVEPPPVDNPLLTAKNCIITPHLAWATRAARARLMRIAAENVRSFLRGKPRNVVQNQ